jgi:hypothetical protein
MAAAPNPPAAFIVQQQHALQESLPMSDTEDEVASRNIPILAPEVSSSMPSPRTFTPVPRWHAGPGTCTAPRWRGVRRARSAPDSDRRRRSDW